jgi:hypothetical protein
MNWAAFLVSAARQCRIVLALAILAGCAPHGVVGSPTPLDTDLSSPVASNVIEVLPVSLSATTGPAADGLAKCHVATYAKQIAGIGIVAHGTLVKEYVPVTGREPELDTASPVFVVQYSGAIREIVLGGAGWIEDQNAVCVVIDGQPIHYVLGPWKDGTGASGTPEPAPYDTKDLPTPLP